MTPILHVIVGPPLGGKTELSKSIISKQLHRKDFVPLLIGHHRGDPYEVSANGRVVQSAQIDWAADILKLVHESDTNVFIDDAHFFDDQLIGVVRKLLGGGLDVCVLALNMDANLVAYPTIGAIALMANRVDIQPAVCECGEDAYYSAVDGDDFVPVCLKHSGMAELLEPEVSEFR